jgi:copper(I)-binding protein
MSPKHAAAVITIAGICLRNPRVCRRDDQRCLGTRDLAGQKVTGAFMQIASTTDTALIDASSPSAKFIEIHEMTKEGGVMKMKAIDRLPIPGGRAVELTSGGYHMMLFELKAPLNAGEVVPMKLTFEDNPASDRRLT